MPYCRGRSIRRLLSPVLGRHRSFNRTADRAVVAALHYAVLKPARGGQFPRQPDAEEQQGQGNCRADQGRAPIVSAIVICHRSRSGAVPRSTRETVPRAAFFPRARVFLLSRESRRGGASDCEAQ